MRQCVFFLINDWTIWSVEVIYSTGAPARHGQAASIGCSMCYISKPAVPPTEGLTYRTVCALCTYTANGAAVRQDTTGRRRGRNGAFGPGDLLLCSPNDAATHRPTGELWACSSHSSRLMKLSRKQKTTLSQRLLVCVCVCVGGQSFRFLISKLIRCVDSLCSLSCS